MSNKRELPLYVLLVPFLLLVIGFELAPLWGMIWDSFHDEFGAWSLQQYKSAITGKLYVIAIKNSILIALYSSVTGITVAIFAAYSITRFSPKTREIFLMLSNMTSNFAGVPLAFAFMILLGTNGLATLLLARLGLPIGNAFDLYSWTGLALVYMYFQIPLAILLLYPTFSGIRDEWKEAAELLGASNVKFWLNIGLPIILPGIVGTFSILFANAMGAYATAYALVGSNYNLLAIRIGAMVSGDIFVQPQLAAALAILLGLFMIGSMWLNERMMRRVRRDLQ